MSNAIELLVLTVSCNGTLSSEDDALLEAALAEWKKCEEIFLNSLNITIREFDNPSPCVQRRIAYIGGEAWQNVNRYLSSEWTIFNNEEPRNRYKRIIDFYTNSLPFLVPRSRLQGIKMLSQRIKNMYSCQHKIGLKNYCDIIRKALDSDDLNADSFTIDTTRGRINEKKLILSYHNFSIVLNRSNKYCSIGRSCQNDLVVDRPVTSRNHAEIRPEKGKFILIDRSQNGTCLFLKNGSRFFIQNAGIVLHGQGIISFGSSFIMKGHDVASYSVIPFASRHRWAHN
ncbi:MAG: FHA domain-containing protein [Candidatus Competibacteraceae bacterium]|nr:FHA domain-containing protein [Candidatus Competibacteraceae bacterium]